MKFSEAAELLSKSGIESPRHDAKEIFIHFGGFSPSDLLVGNPESENCELIHAISRRAAREPLQYIIGEVGFYRETYFVSEACLIPRPDTEILVDYAVKNLTRGASFLDLCTGSGCVAISTLSNTRNTVASAIDISEDAVEIAKRNAERNNVSDRIDFAVKDVTSEVYPGKYDAILSNPPYVTHDAYKALQPEIYHEPKIAFLGGLDGLDFYRAILDLYKDSLKDHGFFAFEIGYDQADSIIKLSEERGFSAEILTDYSSNPRVAVLKPIR